MKTVINNTRIPLVRNLYNDEYAAVLRTTV